MIQERAMPDFDYSKICSVIMWSCCKSFGKMRRLQLVTILFLAATQSLWAAPIAPAQLYVSPVLQIQRAIEIPLDLVPRLERPEHFDAKRPGEDVDLGYDSESMQMEIAAERDRQRRIRNCPTPPPNRATQSPCAADGNEK
jgi:hypothetical protein